MGAVADAPLVARALEMAVSQRRPGEGIIHHADRGCQYTAVTFGSACRAHGITQSNSRKGSPHDNAAKESFFASLEKERLRRRTFATHEQARSSIFQYIEEFYNRRRVHSTLGYRSQTRPSATITSRSSSPDLLIRRWGCQVPPMENSAGRSVGVLDVPALRAGARAYFGPRLGLVPGRRQDV